MIELSTQLVKKFQQLYLEMFQEEISYEKAYEEFYRLVMLVKAVYKSIPKGGI